MKKQESTQPQSNNRVANPPLTSTTTPDQVSKKSHKKLFIILGSALSALLIVGTVGALLVVKSIKNKPENVLGQSFYNLAFEQKDPARVESTIKFTIESPGSPIKNVSIKANTLSDATGKNIQMDIEVDASIINVKGSIFADLAGGNLYLKLDEIPALLAYASANSANLPPEIVEKIKGLDGKWVKISKEDVTELSGNNNFSESYQKCQESISKLHNQSFKDNFYSAYKNNKFLVPENSTTEVVEGRKLLRVDVSLDQDLAKSFAKELGQPQELGDVAKNCGLDSPPSSDSENNTEFKNSKFTVWMDRGKKEVVQISTSTDIYEDEQKASTLSFEFKFSKASSGPTTPTETISIKEVVAIFNFDPSALQNFSPETNSLGL